MFGSLAPETQQLTFVNSRNVCGCQVHKSAFTAPPGKVVYKNRRDSLGTAVIGLLYGLSIPHLWIFFSLNTAASFPKSERLHPDDAAVTDERWNQME